MLIQKKFQNKIILSILLIMFLAMFCQDYLDIKNINNNFKNYKSGIMPESEFRKMDISFKKEVFSIIAKVCNYDIYSIKKTADAMLKKKVTVSEDDDAIYIDGIEIAKNTPPLMLPLESCLPQMSNLKRDEIALRLFLGTESFYKFSFKYSKIQKNQMSNDVIKHCVLRILLSIAKNNDLRDLDSELNFLQTNLEKMIVLREVVFYLEDIDNSDKYKNIIDDLLDRWFELSINYCESLLSNIYTQKQIVDGKECPSKFENFIEEINDENIEESFLIVMSSVQGICSEFYKNIKEELENIHNLKDKELFLDKIGEFLNLLHQSTNPRDAEIYSIKYKCVEFMSRQVKTMIYLQKSDTFKRLRQRGILIAGNLVVPSLDNGPKIRYILNSIFYSNNSANLIIASNENNNPVIIKLVECGSHGSPEEEMQSFEREKHVMQESKTLLNSIYLSKICDMGMVEVEFPSYDSAVFDDALKKAGSSIKLFTIIPKYNSTLKEKMTSNTDFNNLKKYFYHAVLGIRHLHNQGYVYHNINPLNIVIDENQDRALLINFENTERMRDIMFTPRGLEEYRAPEMTNPDKLGYVNKKGEKVFGYERKGKADIWALAVLLCKICKIKPPDKDCDIERVIKDARIQDKDLADLLNGMMQKDYRKRFNIEQVVEHPYFKNYLKDHDVRQTNLESPIEERDIHLSNEACEIYASLICINEQDDKTFCDTLMKKYCKLDIEDMRKILDAYGKRLIKRYKLMASLYYSKRKEQKLKAKISSLLRAETSKRYIRIGNTLYTKIVSEDPIAQKRSNMVIGEGAFSQVIKGYDSEGSPVAIKIIPVYKKTHINSIIREIKIMNTINVYLNIVQILDAGYSVVDNLNNYLREKKFMSDPTLMYVYIVMPLYDESMVTELNKLIKRDKRINIEKVKKYIYELAKAVRSMHKAGCAHRDIKPDNICLDRDEVFLGDFGLSRFMKDEKLLNQGGTNVYMAPEIVTQKRHYRLDPADIWAMGITIGEMLDIFDSLHENSLQASRNSGNSVNSSYSIDQIDPIKFREELHAKKNELDSTLYNLLSHMLEISPNERYNIDEVLCHHFFEELRKEELVVLRSKNKFKTYIRSCNKKHKNIFDIIEGAIIKNKIEDSIVYLISMNLCATDPEIRNLLVTTYNKTRVEIHVSKVHRYDMVSYYGTDHGKRYNIVEIVFSMRMIDFLSKIKEYGILSDEEFNRELKGLILNLLRQLNNEIYSCVVTDLKQKNLFAFFEEIEWLKNILRSDKGGIIMKIIAVVRALSKPISNIPNCLEPLFGNFDIGLFSRQIHPIISSV
jgi:serine/threonine protein kinase